MSHALALYDMASQIDRCRFQLRALPCAPAVPSLTDVSAQVHTLAKITLAASDQVNRRLSGGDLFSADAMRAIEVYSDALAPLGEALTELGRLQAATALFDFTTHPRHRDNPSDLDRSRRQASEIVTGCRDAADEILETTADELRAAAAELAIPPTRAQDAARASSPQTPDTGQVHRAPAAPPAPALPAAAPRTAKGR
ncbi:hypothetical protein ACWEL8_09760 [Streptomyces sp. NPDC004690]